MALKTIIAAFFLLQGSQFSQSRCLLPNVIKKVSHFNNTITDCYMLDQYHSKAFPNIIGRSYMANSPNLANHSHHPICLQQEKIKLHSS